jgi:hypothetical protein
MELDLDVATTPVRDDGRLLIVHEDLRRDAAEPLEGAHERLAGVAVRCPDVEAAGVTESADGEMHLDALPSETVDWTAQSVCSCRPGSVSKRTVAPLPTRSARFGRT